MHSMFTQVTFKKKKINLIISYAHTQKRGVTPFFFKDFPICMSEMQIYLFHMHFVRKHCSKIHQKKNKEEISVVLLLFKGEQFFIPHCPKPFLVFCFVCLFFNKWKAREQLISVHISNVLFGVCQNKAGVDYIKRLFCYIMCRQC